MKKFLSIIIFSIILSIPFVEAKDNGSIEHIGGDTLLSYDGKTITIHDESINYDTQKCPLGYHIGTVEDWATTTKIWRNIKGDNYNFMNISSDGYNMSEDYSLDELGDNRRGLYDFIMDIFNTTNISYVNNYYKTSSYGDKHQPYVFSFSTYKSYKGSVYSKTRVAGSIGLYTCDKINLKDGCNANLPAICFKDNTNLQANNGYSKEYNDAYIFAYNNKITSMETIEKANIYGEIKRMEIAKMLSNWVKIFGFYQDPNIPCNFTDTSSVKGDLATAIIESCRYGIMGQGITKFRPNDKITRAEVATAISRILRGPQYDGGTPYYINHINALKIAGVISNTSNVKENELRGNVMVMLMKANDILKYNLIDCRTCNLDSKDCANKCKNN